MGIYARTDAMYVRVCIIIPDNTILYCADPTTHNYTYDFCRLGYVPFRIHYYKKESQGLFLFPLFYAALTVKTYYPFISLTILYCADPSTTHNYTYYFCTWWYVPFGIHYNKELQGLWFPLFYTAPTMCIFVIMISVCDISDNKDNNNDNDNDNNNNNNNNNDDNNTNWI